MVLPPAGSSESWDPYAAPNQMDDDVASDSVCQQCGEIMDYGLLPSHTIFYSITSWLTQFLSTNKRLDGESVWSFQLLPRYHPTRHCQSCRVAIVQTGVKLTMSEARRAFTQDV